MLSDNFIWRKSKYMICDTYLVTAKLRCQSFLIRLRSNEIDVTVVRSLGDLSNYTLQLWAINQWLDQRSPCRRRLSSQVDGRVHTSRGLRLW